MYVLSLEMVKFAKYWNLADDRVDRHRGEMLTI